MGRFQLGCLAERDVLEAAFLSAKYTHGFIYFDHAASLSSSVPHGPSQQLSNVRIAQIPGWSNVVSFLLNCSSITHSSGRLSLATTYLFIWYWVGLKWKLICYLKCATNTNTNIIKMASLQGNLLKLLSIFVKFSNCMKLCGQVTLLFMSKRLHPKKSQERWPGAEPWLWWNRIEKSDSRTRHFKGKG